jgi:hypothetical protein
MQSISSFPPGYPLVDQCVRAIVLPHNLSEDLEAVGVASEQCPATDSGNADFFVETKGGETYSFLACMPDFVECYMERENERSFVSPGLLLVRDISLESILAAVEDCLQQGALERLGVLQVCGEPTA